jgi:PilZ domain
MSGHTDVRSPRPFPFLKSYPVHLQHADSPEPQPLAGHVVGTVNGQRIILGGISATVLAPGEAVIVRMAVGSEVLGFHTLVAEACGTEMPLYLLEMPETVESINLRKGARLNVFVPADVQYSHGTPTNQSAADLALVQGRMLNLSREGCCLSTKRPLTVNQPIRLAFSLPGGRSTYRVPAKVLRHLGAREGVFVQGVQFEKEQEHLPVLADLQQWISQNLPFAVAS